MRDFRSQSQPFLACQYTFHPAAFVGAGGVEFVEVVGQLPEASVFADAVFDEEAFEEFATVGGEQDHGLVDAVQHSGTGGRAFDEGPTGLGSAKRDFCWGFFLRLLPIVPASVPLPNR